MAGKGTGARDPLRLEIMVCLDSYMPRKAVAHKNKSVLLGAELSSTRGDLGLMSVTVFGSQAQLSSARCQAGSEAC